MDGKDYFLVIYSRGMRDKISDDITAIDEKRLKGLKIEYSMIKKPKRSEYISNLRTKLEWHKEKAIAYMQYANTIEAFLKEYDNKKEN